MPEVEFHAQQSDLKVTFYLDGNDLMCDSMRSRIGHWLHTSEVVYNMAGLMCKFENRCRVSLRHSEKLYQQCVYLTVTICCVVGFAVLLA